MTAIPAGPGKRVSVVLMNLGGPDGPADVGPFLRNLFSDPAIIRLPGPFRWLLAQLISRSRTRAATANYAKMGGGSPLLPETKKQAAALEAELARRGYEPKVVIAMRYWRPDAGDAAYASMNWAGAQKVLLPLYPQFSSTTTASSLKAWDDAHGGRAKVVCCYPDAPKFIAAHANVLVEAWEKAGKPGNVRLLFSAHGLPEQVIKAGDPYQWQVERTAAALKRLVPPDWETEICYQSRVGRLKWIGPSTEECIEQAAKAGKAILVCPIAFVSEHIETLVELDIDYRKIADAHAAKAYVRAPALGVEAGFISELADLVEGAFTDADPSPRSHCGGRICPLNWTDCPNHRPPTAA